VRLDAAALRAHPHASPFGWDVNAKRNVVATWPAASRGGRSLILNGHIDVVPPAAAELWQSPPYAPRRDGDWLYGRGAGDIEGRAGGDRRRRPGAALAEVALAGDVHLQSVVEEECTGNGRSSA